MKIKRAFRQIGIIIGSFVIMSVSAYAGVAVCMWIDGKDDKPIVVEEITSNKSSTASTDRPKQNENVPVGVSLQMISSPIKPGELASISIRTNREASCEISVKYNEIEAEDSGLITKTADEYGTADWTWKVASTTPSGKWPVKVLCTKNGRSGMVIGDLVVVR